MSEHCGRCDRWFVHWRALQQHKENHPSHNICGSCKLDFDTRTRLKAHWVQSPRHPYCQYCEFHFGSSEDLEGDYINDHDNCRKCREVFKNTLELHEHYRQSEYHHYCEDCGRDFQSASNLTSHLNSSIHQNQTIACPSHGCRRSFITLSHLTLHLESGNCPSGVNRPTVNRYVRQYDRNNVITDPSRLLTGPEESAQDTFYSANEGAWNGCAYECYLCHNTFGTLAGLNQHLASPRHQEKIYLCPLSTCRQRFPTLSGLCQHIESQKCGVAKFRIVQRTLDGVMGRMRMLTV
ncbi:hypothetical protein K435DRAFT_440398 [Dendrothele bispora CBS 962.96]|uniref:C2H2-type domain-containing protein n=1 Tax=Dendrothele bispora (strain CBS 962.96) TaxID=1314807 RepID=A0A4S8MDG7_DENBC|nr:hypothetical protein K435DRAFT_440398 [Dendrothele bispora CBS 962.96]